MSMNSHSIYQSKVVFCIRTKLSRVMAHERSPNIRSILFSVGSSDRQRIVWYERVVLGWWAILFLFMTQKSVSSVIRVIVGMRKVSIMMPFDDYRIDIVISYIIVFIVFRLRNIIILSLYTFIYKSSQLTTITGSPTSYYEFSMRIPDPITFRKNVKSAFTFKNWIIL